MSATNFEQQLRNFVIPSFLFGDASRMPGDAESPLAIGIVDFPGVPELEDLLEGDIGIPIPVAGYETIPANLGSVNNITRFVAGKRTRLST